MSTNRSWKRYRTPCRGRFLFWGSCLLLLLALPFSASAQRLPIKLYTTADGLPGTFVLRIVRDSYGFLWFCTRNGLSRFDDQTRLAPGHPDRRRNTPNIGSSIWNKNKSEITLNFTRTENRPRLSTSTNNTRRSHIYGW